MRGAAAAAFPVPDVSAWAADAAGRPPRVLMLTVGLGVGGAEQLILATAPRLRDRGFDVTVGALKSGRGPIAVELEAAGIPCVTYGAASRRDWRAPLRLYAHLRRGRFDLLHAHLFLANLAGRLAGRLARVPVVITSHHDTDVWMGARHRMAERLTARLSDRVVTCSEAVRRYAIDTYAVPPGRVVTLRNAIAVPPRQRLGSGRAGARAALGAAPGDLLVATLGRLDEPKKGLAVFLSAAALIAADEPRARFAIVGDGPARAGLESLAAGLGLGGRMVFAGERRDVAALLDGVDLFVQPSLWEGFGLTVIEAMAAARPVVATAVGGIPEVVRDGVEGLLVQPGDPQALAAAVLRLARDPDLAERLGSAGRERAETEFDLDPLVDATARLYRDLLGGARGGRR